MIEQTTLNEILKNLSERSVIRIDASLNVVNETFFQGYSVKQALKKKQEPKDSSTIFLIGLYTCSIKNRSYTINVLLFPRDYQILVPPEKIFDEQNPHPFGRLLKLRSAELNKMLKKKVNPYNTFMDVIASEYYIIGAKRDQFVVNKLKKKLRRYRLRHLKEKKVLKSPLPKTQFGNEIRTLFSVLNLNTHVKRSRRKKINSAIRKQKSKLREQFKQNRIAKQKHESLLQEQRLVRFKRLKEKKEAMFYLERLKTYEKACKDTDLNPLDFLFESFKNP